MKKLDYIDNIVKESIGELKMPVDSSWKDVQDKINKTPKEVVKTGNNFFTSFFAKISYAIISIGIFIGGFFAFFNNNAQNNKIKKPADITIEILVSKKSNNVTVNTSYPENNTYNNNNSYSANKNDNINYNQNKDTSKVITIIKDTTKIDTVRNK